MDIVPYLKLMVQKNGSDLFFSTGAAPHLKTEGETRPIGTSPMQPNQVRKLAYGIMNDDQIKEYEATFECNLAISVNQLGRFRVNVYRQRGDSAMVIRYIKGVIPPVEKLNLPIILKDLIMEPRGLVLVVGATGSGKSTTLAAMIEHRNQNATGHILTIEDPIEYLYTHKKSVVDQREVGLDTLSYENALKNAMREAPDVIQIGEVREMRTMQHAIAYAETGHLALSTLHANNANQALDRIINFFPDTAHHQLFMDLSLNLKAVISQRLVKGINGQRLPAVEIMLLTTYISELIQKGDIHGIKEVMEQGTERGMQTFDQSLYKLYKEGKISMEEALSHADSRNNLSLKIRLSDTEGVEAPGGLGVAEDHF
ncbi:MAG: type IV pili twitching motility protein PilT [gamma proteobacterium symbiont of Ctena orbiculata]|uniref:PilT/PilU family type 4a pilus ATPase n=1 Tax=Candidatus Thiodiazotropha taylori TaxID=2792791 RepID=A0A944M8P8_9GAMM|nr:PilT/PilU family type 4a pilus ATPase [Candidatus Thiodiazotropha taylori]PUB84284.1 MAG: type IV pili twitching motility protein PilT [gamma proteobacterium symbiont of Ctena orbiculata]MBT2987398.1 PilT/PilU family type 4a pilus ATPase [Candidatus Thiodiazotropha taylori]MBT2995348.1 PilT/PilU family type 4a pilus ATPase [Candidatus Thiodiazotropha taylori]MBT3001808.1 PilT/PilU family type 4a pilus ATPase [Candidatus Thiodiazotropha taylori]